MESDKFTYSPLAETSCKSSFLKSAISKESKRLQYYEVENIEVHMYEGRSKSL